MYPRMLCELLPVVMKVKFPISIYEVEHMQILDSTRLFFALYLTLSHIYVSVEI